MLSRFGRVLRCWHQLSSAHLNQVKDTPVVPLFFTDRKLVVKPVLKELPKEKKVSFQFVQRELPAVPAAPTTRYPEEEKKLLPNRKFCVATRKRLNISIKKMNAICMHVRKIHVLDALAKLEPLKSKCAPWLSGIMRAAIRNGIAHKGMDGERMYVSEIILGKNRPIKGRRYAAKGRVFEAIKPFSQVTVVLEEKSIEEFYKILVTGHFSVVLANMVRNKFLVESADLDLVRRYQSMLTAKGRQQQRLMFKRKVKQVVSDHKAKGVYISLQTAEKNLLETEAKEFAERYWANKRKAAEERIEARQDIYRKNEGL